MKREINCSVRDIVDFVYSAGDILPSYASKNNMRDGTIVHQEIEKQFDCDKEYFVKTEKFYRDYQIFLQGRIDLLDKIGDKYHCIEVKSTHTFNNLDENTYLAHFAQAKFYGLMLYDFLKLDQSTSITISVLYVNKYTYEKKYFTKDYSYTELENFFNETMDKYIDFFSAVDSWSEIKLNSITELSFPYDYRSGQKELVDKVYEVINNKETLFVCAPTGIGKSLGTIYPSLKTINNKDIKLFYLTSKTIIKDVARNAVSLLRTKSGLKLKSLTLTAKDKICINNCVRCNPKDCKYAKDFFGKVNEAQLDIFNNVDDMHYDNIVYYAKKYEICPFEFQLNLTLMVDMVICDYNYVFDLRVYLRRFFDFDTQHLVLLIDEAHNMYDRVCNMYTISINLHILNVIANHVPNELEIQSSIRQISDKLGQYQNQLRNNSKNSAKFFDIDEALLDDVEILVSRLEKYFDKLRNNDKEISEELIDNYFELSSLLKVAEYYSHDFIIWVENRYDDINYQITCLNPRDLIKMKTDKVKSSVFFSATLHPIDYYMSVLGGNSESKQLILNSPFKQENLKLLINSNISTKYNDREMTKYSIAYEIDELIKNGGKYLIYFSSYQYLELVYKTLIKVNNFSGEIFKQDRDMTESEKSSFIARFDESNNNIVGLAVLGGIFSEGIDLQGEKLNGVVVVGVGLPQFDDFRNELRQYFDNVYKRGYQFAYVYPGFNKVLQAVGRVIRSETDTGVALLIDDRYKTCEYLKLFPGHWSHYQKKR